MEGNSISSNGVRAAEALAHGRRLLGQQPQLAEQQARAILDVEPHHAGALRLLGAALRARGEREAALAAEAQALAAARRDPTLMEAAAALVANDLAAAEPLLRGRLKRDPYDVAAIRMMAELAARVGRSADSESLLRRAIELAPGFDAARANLATLLYRQHRAAEALELLDEIATSELGDAHHNLRAAALGRIGGYDEAIAIYRDVLERHTGQAKLWMSLAHMLKTVGKQEEAVAAYRRAIGLAPAMGEGWWSLANLKTVRFGADDLAAMESALDGSALDADDELHLHFALGKGHEDRGDDEAAWRHYAAGNALRRDQLRHDPARPHALVEGNIALLDAEFFAERAGRGCPARDPIFILGMPRAGSTLVEQILASHSQVEGTMELPDIIAMVRRLDGSESAYPAILASLDSEALAALGREYLERTRVARQTEKPYFIDKMPNNWVHAGLIRLILPNARIIDARRHPLACGFSNFKQHYARGQAFSYDLGHFGAYYADYVRLMAHLDRVQPGKIHRVIHEALVDDPEREVRDLLTYLGLEFEEECLRFHENKRAVRTASSEQVRRPISRDGIDQWRRFERWLGPLEAALGTTLDRWDDAPRP
jgi:tetratricopeptide (TPR) repeat protein